jgi:SAM-dependent methyltransferase
MTLLPKPPARVDEAAIWQDVEFGSYAADLALWEELAAAAGGPVLELGAGSGRVAIHLARSGVEVIAVERDAALAAELAARAEGLPLRVVAADLAEIEPSAARLAIGPLQVIQLLDGPERAVALAAMSAALGSGGRCALALVDESTLVERGADAPAPISPDMREVDGWVYSSEPLWVQVSDDVLRMRRLRERVSPTGDIVRRVHDDILHRLSLEQLEAEGSAAGLRPAGRRAISSSAQEAGSIVVMLEAT